MLIKNSLTECNLNEVYTGCGYCEDACGTNSSICTQECKPEGCYCNYGYWRDQNGVCILKYDCPECKL